jgi:CheY-like chemotaxis protein
VVDIPGDARLLTEHLSESGILEVELERTETLQEALFRLRNGARPPNVVLLDLDLPDATGLEVVDGVV